MSDGAQIAHFAGGDLTSLTLLLAAGRSKGEIAEAVGLDERTVSWRLEHGPARKLERASALHKQVRGNK